ncbi:DUF397 domain-containing protein [Streptomyces tubbatahanensis]|uniref:DUF397 domain-containing protein n=1 Tax=Streptomyces tubbatahanensis TaxID=2923272 RepID=A0ABY3XUX7_9ACTN|nr:DUF397 domain-containing protein [Streptomyces tubbatahanensis]UNS98185.1 DUF397 domain-containing protein [Streptomyces tubbatahanensis]
MTSARRSTSNPPGTKWRTSSYSGGNNECVEVAPNPRAAVRIRDTKRRTGPVITVAPDTWTRFLQYLG